MSQYAGWEPKEFSDVQPVLQQSTWQPQEFDDSQEAQQQHAQQPAAASTTSMNWQQQQQQQPSGDWQQGQGQGQNAGQVHSWQQGQNPGQDSMQSHDWQSQQQLAHQLPGDSTQTQQADLQHAQQLQSYPHQSEQWQQQQQQEMEHQQPHQAPGTESTVEDGQARLSFDQPQQQSGQQLDQNQAVPTEAPQPKEEAGGAQAGFVYDSASGYWHDAVSGYYYDANTGMYCHPQTQQWYTQDATTGEFTPFVSEQGISGAAANALGERTHACTLPGQYVGL